MKFDWIKFCRIDIILLCITKQWWSSISPLCHSIDWLFTSQNISHLANLPLGINSFLCLQGSVPSWMCLFGSWGIKSGTINFLPSLPPSLQYSSHQCPSLQHSHHQHPNLQTRAHHPRLQNIAQQRFGQQSLMIFHHQMIPMVHP